MGPEEKLVPRLARLHATVDAGRRPARSRSARRSTPTSNADQAVQGRTCRTAASTTLHDAARRHARLVHRPRRQPERHADPFGAGRQAGHGHAPSAWYQIEEGYDYLYGEYSVDDGATWSASAGAVDGVSQRPLDHAARTPTRRRRPSLFRFRYQTDGGVQRGRRLPRRHRGQGRQPDHVHRRRRGRHQRLDSEGLDGSRPAPRRSTPRATTCSRTAHYVGYDATLQVGPVPVLRGGHPSELGRALPVPGRHAGLVRRQHLHRQQRERAPRCAATRWWSTRDPSPMVFGDGTKPTNRRQPFDATFGLQPHRPGRACTSRWRTRRPRATRHTRRVRPADAGDRRRSTTAIRRRTGARPTRRARSRSAGHGVRATVTGHGRRLPDRAGGQPDHPNAVASPTTTRRQEGPRPRGPSWHARRSPAGSAARSTTHTRSAARRVGCAP